MAQPIEWNDSEPLRLGRYEILERIGRGGMAEVYKARLAGALGVEKRVAVKRILPEAFTDPHFVKLFVREARLSTRLQHPNLIQVFEFAQEERELFLAMELIEGCDLRKVLNAQRQLGKPMPTEIALCVIHGVLQGLEFAHRLTDEQGAPLNVVHRDLSPSNVLLSYAGAVKVADFGVAHVDGPEKSDANLLKGKVSYMAPEQLTGKGVDARTDVFAAACVLYEMLAGEPVYSGKVTPKLVRQVARGEVPTVRNAIPYVDPALAAVMQRALSPKPAERTASCERFDQELMELVNTGRLRCAREGELALYLEVLVPKPVPSEVDSQPQPPIAPTVASKKPPPSPRQEGGSVIELRTSDVEPLSMAKSPESVAMRELLAPIAVPPDASQSTSAPEPLVPKAVVLRLTPAPVVDSRSLSEPLLLDKPVVELVKEPSLPDDDDDVLEPPRRWPRALAALFVVAVIGAGAVQAQKYLPHAWTPGFVPGPPFEPAKVALVLDDSKLKVDLPVITLSAPEPKPRKPAKKIVPSTGHW
ncbi:MAG: protein kinase [Deltaproteobacteria bacterium]|nr:protein kinase [Deltaproteobacteria bacterium]